MKPIPRIVPILFGFFSFGLLITPPAQASGFSDCYTVAKQVFLESSDAVHACRKAGVGFNSCYKIARVAFLEATDAVKACGEAGAGFNDCYGVAKTAYLETTDAVAVCGSAQ